MLILPWFLNNYTVSCPSLTPLENGVINCSLGDDTYNDTCNFTCNTGYEIIGDEARTCQSDGSWSGNEIICSRGILAILTHIAT